MSETRTLDNLEGPAETQLECLDDNGQGTCGGEVRYRMALSATGKNFPRCDHHWEQAFERYIENQERYPENAPSDFDPAYAGERWDDDY